MLWSRFLHWLRVPERVTFRLRVLAYRCLHGTAPSYLSDSLLWTSDVVCALLTQPRWWYRPPDVQHLATVPFQWLRHVRGTACRRLSGMHRRWRRFIANWRLYFFGHRLTMIKRSRLYCTGLLYTCGCGYRLSPLLSYLFDFVRCPCNVFDMTLSP